MRSFREPATSAEGSNLVLCGRRTLTAMLKKDSEIGWGAPKKELMASFRDLEKNLSNPAISRLPKPGAPYKVDTDATQCAIGAMIIQEREVEGDVAGQKVKRWVTIDKWTKTLIDDENNYSAT